LQRDDLRRGANRDGENLPEQCGTPDNPQRKNVAADGRLDDRVSYVGSPTHEVVA
jgi:hypothetical protein